MIPQQRGHNLRRDRVDAFVHATAELLHEVPDQQQNILGPLAQRRNTDRKNVQAIVEIRAELLLIDQSFQVPVRCGDQPRIRTKRARAPQSFKLALLQDAKKLRLQFERNLPDFVQENGSAVRQLKPPDALRDGARERAFFVPEQFAFQQPGRDGRAVQFHESV